MSRLLSAMLVVGAVAAPAAALGPNVTFSPQEPTPGSTLTVSGSGWTAGHVVDVSFLGLFETTYVGDDGTFSVQFVIPLETPTDEGSHPLEVEIYGEGGGGYIFLPFNVPIVEAPEPPTTTQATTTTSAPPPPTTQVPVDTTEAPTTTEATATTVEPTTTLATATTIPEETPPTTVPGDSDGGGGGFPWWIVGIALVVILLGGLVVFFRWPWEPEPAFVDSSGQGWLWCASSACGLQHGKGTNDVTNTREVRIRAIGNPKKACPGGCTCVLFFRPRRKSKLDFVNDDQTWVAKKPTGKYLARCVKKG